MRKDLFTNILKIMLAAGIFLVGAAFIWVATFDIPDIQSLNDRQVELSTKIYDKTGETVLYNLNQDVRRTSVPLSEVSDNMQAATLAIEDSDFYQHMGIKPSAIIRAAWTNLKAGEFEQGGSTITQQVVKNTLLTPKKTIARKVKEWILAVRLDQKLSKNEILEIYLNEVPYGGRVYGVEEAAKRYFGKSASDLTIAESAYLAALPKAPTYYSPYGNNRDELDARKNEVLSAMYKNGFINQKQYQQAKNKDVTFTTRDQQSLRAPHFVFYIKQYLEQKYGTTAIERRGLKVITTLDYDLQRQAHNVLQEYGQRNAKKYNANNAALVAVEPDTGKIRVMVGSRDYGNKKIEGSFNAATAKRQPGSAFKPFAYATALQKGYTDDTVVFDLPTQFSNVCPVSEFGNKENCFSPVNYDGKFRGPITLRDALAQSVNIPSVKTLYLAGIADTIKTAEKMGVKTLSKDPGQYGLSLVLGSGEVTLLDMTSAYGVFANEGVKNPHTGIKRIEDADGEVLETFEKSPQRVLETQIARQMNDILSDNVARAPAFGPNSPLYFENYDVAAKTGTTNNYRDLWTIGYSPNLAVGVWSGNNDNSPVDGEVAGFVVAPMWHAFMEKALKTVENERFTPPAAGDHSNLKPVLRGVWNTRSSVSKNAQGVPTALNDTSGGVHSILHWVHKNNPRGPIPNNPSKDPQYDQWEYSIQRWLKDKSFTDAGGEVVDSENMRAGNMNNSKPFSLAEPIQDQYQRDEVIDVKIKDSDDLDRLEVRINEEVVGDDDSQPFAISIDISDNPAIKYEKSNNLTITTITDSGQSSVRTFTFEIRKD